jgi:hypothetical protein
MMRTAPESILFLAFLLVILPVALHAQAGWTTHNDAKGFAMDTPPGWNFTSDTRAGRIVVQGTRGEQVVVWPGSIQQTLDARGAAMLVQQLARRVDAQMLWGAAAATDGAVRTIAKSPQRSGVAMMTWSSSAGGTSVLFYCVEAPASAYRAETDTFTAILRSFRVVQEATANTKPGVPITFTTWTEPHENAYSVSVPQGWKTVGGAYRLSPTDV